MCSLNSLIHQLCISNSTSEGAYCMSRMLRAARQSNLHPHHWVTVSVATTSSHCDFVPACGSVYARVYAGVGERSTLIKQMLSHRGITAQPNYLSPALASLSLSYDQTIAIIFSLSSNCLHFWSVAFVQPYVNFRKTDGVKTGPLTYNHHLNITDKLQLKWHPHQTNIPAN